MRTMQRDAHVMRAHTTALQHAEGIAAPLPSRVPLPGGVERLPADGPDGLATEFSNIGALA